MKFSLKTLAAAAVMAVAASSSFAAIDNGAGGNGELFFSAWDGATSYNYDLNISIDSFEAGKNAAGLLNLSYGSDFTSSFGSWVSTANKSSLEWNIVATDVTGQRRILSTVGAENSLPATNKQAGDLRTAATAIQGYIDEVNPILVGNSAVTSSISAGSYAGKMGTKLFDRFTFDTTGNLLADSYANGLVFQKTTANATGLVAGANTAYVDNGVAVRSWIGSDNTLHIGAVAAVPEPESYAMLLAGLGMIGLMARRRQNRA
ncbi:PEP-CTERM sorting domain-containing protein [Azonexus sp. IMCC34842]|uniref:PEP-CTERM sorting domain-containing protein n=1 Tax=Azonexus sp. IMCC34842 TaxID=3420950 RepID=UPI003D109BC5